MKTNKVIIVAGLLMVMGGCYTQFQTFDERYPAYPRESIGETSDSTAALEGSTGEKDTVVIKEREVCNWERTFFGDWELRCYESNYSNYWHRYYNRPWWYHSYNYDAYDCHCPYHVFYHPNCEYCWYHCDRYSHYGYGNQIYNPHIQDNSGSSTGSISTESTGKTPVKIQSDDSGRKGISSESEKKPVGPVPSTSISVPKKKPDEKITNTGNTPSETDNTAAKPKEPQKRSRKNRFGRGR